MPDPVNEKADADKPPCQHLNCVRVGRVADNRWACLRCGVPMVEPKP